MDFIFIHWHRQIKPKLNMLRVQKFANALNSLDLETLFALKFSWDELDDSVPREDIDSWVEKLSDAMDFFIANFTPPEGVGFIEAYSLVEPINAQTLGHIRRIAGINNRKFIADEVNDYAIKHDINYLLETVFSFTPVDSDREVFLHFAKKGEMYVHPGEHREIIDRKFAAMLIGGTKAKFVDELHLDTALVGFNNYELDRYSRFVPVHRISRRPLIRIK